MNLTPAHKRFTLPWIGGSLAMIVMGQIYHRYSLSDDAYITYRFSRNLAEGHGLVWNIGGERVEGFTSFLHMALCAAAYKVGIDPGLFAQSLNILAVGLICGLGYRHLTRSFDDDGRAAAFCFWLYFALCPAYIARTFSGLETPFFALMVFATTLALEHDLTAKKLPILTSILAALTAMTRPEGYTLGLTAGICILVFSGDRRMKNAAVFAAVAGIPFVTYFALRWSYFGWFFPNTYYVKVGHLGLLVAIKGLWYVLWAFALFAFPYYLIYLLFSLGKKRKQMDLGARLHLIVFSVLTLQVILEGGDYLFYGRFIMPILPSGAVVLAELLALRKSLREEAPPPKSRWISISLVLAVTFLNPVVWMNHFLFLKSMDWFRDWEIEGQVLRQSTPEDALLATVGIGAIGWHSERPLIDMLGLADTTVAHTEVKTGRSLAGHEKHNTEYVLKRKPAILLICNQMSQTPVTECACLKLKKFTAEKDIMLHQRFKSMYTFANLKSDKGYLAAFVRNDLLGAPGYENWAPAADVGQPCQGSKLQGY